jgi:hypothetical protein
MKKKRVSLVRWEGGGKEGECFLVCWEGAKEGKCFLVRWEGEEKGGEGMLGKWKRGRVIFDTQEVKQKGVSLVCRK